MRFSQARERQSDNDVPSGDVLQDLAVATEQLNQARNALDDNGSKPQPLLVGEEFPEVNTRGGKGIFFAKLTPVDEAGNPVRAKPQTVGEPVVDGNVTSETLAYADHVRLRGEGNFKLDFLLYQATGIDLTSFEDSTLATLELPPKIVMPFMVMILLSLITRPNSVAALDRYYSKMKTPVDPDPQADQANLEAAEADPERMKTLKLFPNSNFEFQRPNAVDIIGFVVCFAACFGIIALAIWVAQLGSS